MSEDIRELVGTLKRSATSWDTLATSINRDRKNRNRWFAGLAAGLTVVVLGVGWLLVRQSASADRGQAIKSLTATVADCTTPGGNCYEREQTKERDRDRRNLLLILAVADCSTQGGRGAELRECVNAKMAAAGGTLDQQGSDRTP